VPVAATCARLLKGFLPRYVPPASTLARIDGFCGYATAMEQLRIVTISVFGTG
jgi:hypothetical protein